MGSHAERTGGRKRGAHRAVPVLTAIVVALGVVTCGGDAPLVLEPGDGDIHQADPNRLLTDDELRTPADSAAPEADPRYVAWLDGHAEPIRSLTSDDFSDLRFLEPLLAGKRIVQLGESAHGVAQYSQLKARLVRYLHEELGYSVLAFESPLYDCARADEAVKAGDLLVGCLFRVWHVDEVDPVFVSMEAERAAGDPHPLRLAGFDDQINDLEILAGRPAWFYDLVGTFTDWPYSTAVRSLDASFVSHYTEYRLRTASSGFDLWLTENADSLKTAYMTLADSLEAHRATIEAAYPDQPELPVLAVRTARSTVAFIDQLLLEEGSRDRVITRDSTMARNLEALLETHPNEKVIIWGHNFHLRYDNASVPEYRNLPTMGTWVRERWGDELYTIGFYMYRGTAAFNDRNLYILERPPANSLESIAYHVRKKFLFFDIGGAEPTSGNEWLFEPVTTMSWGIDRVTMTLADQYDGIIYVDQVSPPSYFLDAAGMTPRP